MADNIKGLKVEISADATKFKQELKDLKSQAKTTQTDLNALQKSLKLEFDNTKFVQAQKTAQEAIDKTADIALTLKERLAYLEKSGKVNTAEYRNLQNELSKNELKALELKKQLEEINKIKIDHVASQFTNLGSGIEKAGKALAPLSALAVGGVTAIGALGVKTATFAAHIDDLALRLGISAQKVQEYQYVTAQAGVEWEVFEKALIKARGAMLDLSTGTTSTATQAFKKLGLNINNFATQSAMFDGIIEALSQMQDKTLQAAYANDIFGDKIANQMLPYLNAGSEAINQFKSEFAQTGALTNEQVIALAGLDDTLFLLKQSFEGVLNQLGATFAPLIKYIADTLQTSLIPQLQRLTEWFNSLTLGQQELALKALLFIAVLAPLTMGIGKAVSTVGNLIKLLPMLNSALSLLAAHPIIAIIAVIAALLVYLYTTNEKVRESINNLLKSLGGALQPILNTLMNTLQVLLVALQPILNIIGNMLATALENLAGLITWLTPIFNKFAQVVTNIFKGVVESVNTVLSWIETAINWAIDLINGMVEAVNKSMGWLGVNIGKLSKVNIQLDTSKIEWLKDINSDINTGEAPKKGTQEDTSNPSTPQLDFNKSAKEYFSQFAELGQAYDKINSGVTMGDTYNNDYSTVNKTQNITVTIQNYAQEVDTDQLIREINLKLAEAY